MIGIDLFSGAGGMSLGAQWAGVRLFLAVESDPFAAGTFKVNHPDVQILCKPIQSVDAIVIPEELRPLVVFGGPPCQGFSTSNQRTRSLQNPGNWLFREYMRIVRMVRPEWVVFENVTGMATTESGTFLRAILADFAEAGYSASHFVLNAAEFGIPQRRSRLFVVASLEGRTITTPKAATDVRTSVRDAIGDLPVLRNGAYTDELPYRTDSSSAYARLLRKDLTKCKNHIVSLNAPMIVERFKHVPQGGNWADIPARLMKNYQDRTRCHTGIYHRLRYDEPSVVIGNYRKNMLIHPTQTRGLSVREAARLQSFPDDFVFTGSIGFQQQQVGNAVPPLLAKAVFDAIQNPHAGAA
jgi:DNA (cytosine-5)-methyltransferase 1